MTYTILIKFLVILTIIFFLPRLLNKITKLPNNLIEIILGATLGIALPAFFFIDDTLNVLSTIGIISLFVYAGLEADYNFVLKRKKFFLENLLLHIMIVLIIGSIIHFSLKQNYQISLLISLALTTPSASYIISSLKNESMKDKKWIEGKAIVGEITAIFLLVIFLRLQNIFLMISVFVAIILLIFILPYVLDLLYKKIFGRLIGMEFSLIFVISLISAFITDLMGLHFLVGAFIAGMISRKFISDIVKDPKYKKINKVKEQQILKSFSFFVMIFIPFHFFTVGLKLKPELFTVQNILIALVLAAAISLIRIVILSAHRNRRLKERIKKSTRISYALIPTLVFTFIITEILRERFEISQNLFGTLIIYGILTTVISIILITITKHKKRTKKK